MYYWDRIHSYYHKENPRPRCFPNKSQLVKNRLWQLYMNYSRELTKREYSQSMLWSQWNSDTLPKKNNIGNIVKSSLYVNINAHVPNTVPVNWIQQHKKRYNESWRYPGNSSGFTWEKCICGNGEGLTQLSNYHCAGPSEVMRLGKDYQ